MEAQAFTASPYVLSQVVDHILTSRRITRQDQRLLMSLKSPSSEEQSLINRVYEALHRGLLKVAD